MLAAFSIGQQLVISAGPPELNPQDPFHLGTAATKPEFHTYLQAAEWGSRDRIE